MTAVGLGGWGKDAETGSDDGAEIAAAMAVAAAGLVAGLTAAKRRAVPQIHIVVAAHSPYSSAT